MNEGLFELLALTLVGTSILVLAGHGLLETARWIAKLFKRKNNDD